MKKLIVFDLDQTLLYTLPRFHRVFCSLLGREIPWDEFIKHYAADSLNIYINGDKNEFWKRFLKNYYPPHPEDRPIDGAKETLKTLKDKGFKIVVHTGRIIPKNLLWDELKIFGLATFIDDVYPEDENFKESTFDKSPKLLEIKEKYSPDFFAFVGDYWPDMVSGKKAGAFVIGVLTGLEKEEKLKKYGADVVVKSVAEVPEVLPI